MSWFKKIWFFILNLWGGCSEEEALRMKKDYEESAKRRPHEDNTN